MSVASGSCLPCVEDQHALCIGHKGFDCPCNDRDHAPTGPDAPWTFADLDALERDYGRGGHDDVAALIRGVRAVLRLHVARAEYPYFGCCDHCDDDGHAVTYPCPTVTALAEGATR